MKVAVVTGVTGQDGSYLVELLLEKGYYVYGLNRRTSLPNTERIAHLLKNHSFQLCEFDMSDSISMMRVFKKIPSDYERLEVYNLAAQSHVWTSFYQPEHSTIVDGLGTLKLLEVILMLELKNVRFYQASSSELYGKVQAVPQNESTPFYPRSPYAIAKLYSYWITRNFRESYGLFACNGILFNHESERRGKEFVTRKITTGVAEYIKTGKSVIELGNLDANRDWGHAKDYVEGMWRILQHDMPDDYVLATGETHSVREFVEKAFRVKGIEVEWRSEKEYEQGFNKSNGDLLVSVNPTFYRPAEVDLLVGDASKAKSILQWSPTISFDTMISLMVNSDCQQ